MLKWEHRARKQINLITSNTSNEKVILKAAVLISETIRTCILAYKIKCSFSLTVAFDFFKLKHMNHLLYQQI